MIGQTKLLSKIEKMSKNNFPRFSIIVGPKHSGKHLVADFIASQIGAYLAPCDIKVDDVRNVIETAYAQTEPIVYMFADADRMSLSAKNALLKVTEEPPKQAYFIITLQDGGNTLETIRSRGTMFNLDPYSAEELMQYCEMCDYDVSDAEMDILLELCTNPGEVDTLVSYNITEFYDFVFKVVDNIGIVHGANAFKIGNSIKYDDKETNEVKWDVHLFLRAVKLIYRRKMNDAVLPEYVESIKITGEHENRLSINGINKANVIDMWILALRGIWVE